MNQKDLFPYFIDKTMVNSYRVALSELKLLREVRAGWIEDLRSYKRMKRDLKRICDASTEGQLKHRRLLKKFEANENDIKQCEEFKNIDFNIRRWEARLVSAKSAINDSRGCNKKPLRFFSGIKFGQPSEWGVKIFCRPMDEAGHRIFAAENQKHEKESHDKGFLFVISPDRIKILEIEYFGDWQECDVDEFSHQWLPTRVETIGPSSEEQVKAFKIFKQLVSDAEKINGFPITDERHDSILSKPNFRRLLIRILNSKYFVGADQNYNRRREQSCTS